MRKLSWKAVGCLAALCLLGVAPAAAADKALSVGQKVPPFEALDDSGNLWKSKDLLGKKTIVLFFYPAAMTGG